MPPATRWFSTLQDVTAQKQSEARLFEAAAFTQAVSDSVNDHMAVLDRSGMIVVVNEAWRRFALDNNASGEQVGVGVDYLDVCSRSFAKGGADARQRH